ncbi:MAG: TRAP transporter small permease [Bacillota bacterium]
MTKAFSLFDKLLNAMMALSLAVMSLLVFGNVILRYGFNSGITWSSEISRFLFIWLTFLGAIVALKDNKHLAVDLLIKKLPPNSRKVVFVIGNLIILYILWLILDGSWKLTLSSVGSTAPATGISLSIIYAVGVVTSVGMGVIILTNLYRVLVKKVSVEEISDGSFQDQPDEEGR